MEISRDTFKESDTSAQNLILFDSIQSVGEKLDDFNQGCDNKHIKIDAEIVRSGKVNRRVSAGSGLLGGFLAVIATKIFGIS